jgi:hypothetical protein
MIFINLTIFHYLFVFLPIIFHNIVELAFYQWYHWNSIHILMLMKFFLSHKLSDL